MRNLPSPEDPRTPDTDDILTTWKAAGCLVGFFVAGCVGGLASALALGWLK